MGLSASVARADAPAALPVGYPAAAAPLLETPAKARWRRTGRPPDAPLPLRRHSPAPARRTRVA
jgi:hypothetical protein